MSEGFDFEAAGGGDYVLWTTDGSFIVDANRVRWVGDDLIGEIRIEHDGVLHAPISCSFMKTAGRRDMLTLVANDSQWPGVVNELCARLIKAERTSTSPFVYLRDVARPTAEREYRVPHLPPVPRDSMAIWFGDGGTGKSLLALDTAGNLAAQGIRTLYLDWEWDASEHRLRYERLFGADMPAGLAYWPCDKPMPQMIDEIRRVIRQERFNYAIVDSIAYACGGNVESSEVAAQYGQAARSLGIGSLHLAHVTKGVNTHKPFGSAFWHNSARSTWYLEAKGVRTRGAVTETDLELTHRKSNIGPLETRARSLRMTVDGDRDLITLSRNLHLVNHTDEISVVERIKRSVAAAPGSRDHLRAAMADVKPGTMGRTISRGLKDGWLIENADGLIVLADRQTKAA